MSSLLTIVIANYNYGRFIETAITSIINEADATKDKRLYILGQPVELIICDADSSDNSVEIIKKYEDKIYWWCSEKDRGQSAAFNKGFSHGTGKYLTWLNADDLYVQGGLRAAIRQMVSHPNCEWFTGNVVGFLDGGTILGAAIGPHWFPAFLQWKNAPIVVPGPTSFFSRRIYTQVGRIDETLHFTMDALLWVKFIVAGVKQRRILPLVWAFRHHAASKTAEFEGHRHDPAKIQKMNAEFRNAMTGIPYHPSRLIHLFYIFLRCLDGSLIRRYCYGRWIKSIKGVK